jgi:hypothetical protein
MDCALRLLEAGFTDFADAVLEDAGEGCAPVRRLLAHGATPRAMAAIREALAENG